MSESARCNNLISTIHPAQWDWDGLRASTNNFESWSCASVDTWVRGLFYASISCGEGLLNNEVDRKLQLIPCFLYQINISCLHRFLWQKYMATLWLHWHTDIEISWVSAVTIQSPYQGNSHRVSEETHFLWAWRSYGWNIRPTSSTVWKFHVLMMHDMCPCRMVLFILEEWVSTSRSIQYIFRSVFQVLTNYLIRWWAIDLLMCGANVDTAKSQRHMWDFVPIL